LGEHKVRPYGHSPSIRLSRLRSPVSLPPVSVLPSFPPTRSGLGEHKVRPYGHSPSIRLSRLRSPVSLPPVSLPFRCWTAGQPWTRCTPFVRLPFFVTIPVSKHE
jgi:hypothetical protein